MTAKRREVMHKSIKYIKKEKTYERIQKNKAVEDKTVEDRV